MKLTLRMLGLLAVAGATSAFGATIIWNFSDDDAVFDVGTLENFSISAISIGNQGANIADQINATSPSSGYAGASGSENIGTSFRGGELNTAEGGSTYLEFTVTPAAGYRIVLSDFDFAVRSTSTGAQSYVVRSNSDGFVGNIVSGSISTNSNWAYKDNSFSATVFAVNQAVVFRLYGYGGTGNSTTANTRFDDIRIEVSAIPEPSAFAALAGVGALSLCALRRRRA